MELSGRTALLTGATGGLGRAIATALAAKGAKLILSGRKAEALEALAAELPGEGHRVLPADLAEPGAAEKLAAEAGDVDILVANAGLPGTGRLPDYSPEQLTGTLRVNLEAPILLARALEPAMLERGSGHMVFVSSLSGKSATPLSSVYNATKFGLRGFALGLRADLDPLGIGVSIVSPGFDPRSGHVRGLRRQPPIPGLGTGTPSRSPPLSSRRSSRTRSRSSSRRCSSASHFARPLRHRAKRRGDRGARLASGAAGSEGGAGGAVAPTRGTRPGDKQAETPHPHSPCLGWRR